MTLRERCLWECGGRIPQIADEVVREVVTTRVGHCDLVPRALRQKPLADVASVIRDSSETRENAMAAKFEISKDKAGKFRFHLKAPNGEIIAASQGYESKASAEKGIEAIKTHAPKAKVEDHSDT
jgi:uncharacterized protein YegP (UPF0339 family)